MFTHVTSLAQFEEVRRTGRPMTCDPELHRAIRVLLRQEIRAAEEKAEAELEEA